MLAAFAGLLLLAAGPQRAPDAAALYQKHCAVCHDAAAAAALRAPDRRALESLAQSKILAALETGSMKTQAAALSLGERRAIAEFLSSKTAIPETSASAGLCPAPPASTDLSSGLHWSGWGADASNSRFQPAASAGLSASDVGRLKLKWAFGFPGANMAFAHPTVAAGRLFVGSPTGDVYALNGATGCIYWSYKAASGVRTAISVGRLASGRYAAYFGDLAANAYALDAATGALLWKTHVEEHPAARVTGSPQLHAGRLYVPVSSVEEVSAGNLSYPCCRFRGSVVALDAENGKQLWKTYTIPDPPQPAAKSSSGVQLWGPSGAGVWSSPTLDVKRKVLYVATGNAYSDPPVRTSDAVLAIDMDSGSLLWSKQLTPGDGWNFSCAVPGKGSCPADPGKDFDLGASPILRSLPGGKTLLICGQKSGLVHAIDPERRGEIVWQVRVGKGSPLGGVQWGPAADDDNVYVAVSDKFSMPPELAGGLFALRLASGEKVWHTPAPKPPCLGQRGCSGAQSAAVTLIPGAVFSGSLDGHLRAYSAADGAIIWDFDTAQDFATVNGVKARGGSINGPGPAVVAGMLYVNSGYGVFSEMPGNVLLAFSADPK